MNFLLLVFIHKTILNTYIFKGPLGNKGQKGEPSTIAGPQGPKGAAGEKVIKIIIV